MKNARISYEVSGTFGKGRERFGGQGGWDAGCRNVSGKVK